MHGPPCQGRQPPFWAVAAKLAMLDWAAHEWIGLAVYYLQGRTTAFFPAPA